MEVMELADFYKNKKVLITGHTGFKGSWLSIWLLKMEAKVLGYALDPKTDKDNFVLSNISSKITDIRGDVLDIESLEKEIASFQPEIVFHLAAQALVKTSYSDPKNTYETNVNGTVNLLECCRKYDCIKSIIVVTSDKCYENKEWLWGYRENDPLGGYDPYSASKACTEIIAASYRNSFYKEKNIGLATVRAGNVIGGGDWADFRIIPDAVRAFENNQALEIRNLHAVRPWQHVLEPLSGYLKLAALLYGNPDRYAQAYNFGPYQSSVVEVGDLIQLFINQYGTGRICDVSHQEKVHEAGLLNLDISKAIYELNWKPALNLVETVKLTVDWYKEYRSSNVFDLCNKQIECYCK